MTISSYAARRASPGDTDTFGAFELGVDEEESLVVVFEVVVESLVDVF